MNKIPVDYIEKVYAGWMGKIIGVRHGANIEGWDYERIKRTFGEIKSYIHQFKNFAADDDINGPAFFQMALADFDPKNISEEEMGLTWLNYVPDGHAFFWWGGYGNSTEHTAYLNLKNGIKPPRSGSAKQNGDTVAEQIGGQIFSDCWGLIAPGNPELAAKYAKKMSSVSHDKNGIYGGMFIAGAISLAFIENDIEDIINKALSLIPQDSEYNKMSQAIIKFYQKNPDDWRKCFEYVRNNYGYKDYPGNVHIIPNAAIIILSLLYSQGDFSKSINIANMCGWDTDCNVGNIGTITGVLNGIDLIDNKWKEPINDFVCASSVLGSLNILDIPWLASYTANLGYKVAAQKPEGIWDEILSTRKRIYHFEYPGSTHSFQVEKNEEASGFINNSTEQYYKGSRSLKVTFDYVNGGNSYKIYQQTYYTPEDFNDSRYDPSFSPIIYPGQDVETMVYLPKNSVEEVFARIYINDLNNKRELYGNKIRLEPGKWTKLDFSIPELDSACLQKVGIEFIPIQEERWRKLGFPSLVVYVDNMIFSGKANYSIDFSKAQIEKWNNLHNEVRQLTYLRGLWTLEDGKLTGSYYGDSAEAYTGDLYWKNYNYSVTFEPKLGDYHNINFRVQGGIRSYAVGLAPNNKLILYKNNNGYKKLVIKDFFWEKNNEYTLDVKVEDNNFVISINDKKIINYVDEDTPYLYGQVGFSNFEGSRTYYKDFKIE